VTRFDELVSALDGAGLWSGVAEDHRTALRQALVSGADAAWPAGGAWRADGEDLAEGEVEAWLGGMATALADCGVELRLATVIGPFGAGSTGYAVAVNGTRLDLYEYVPGGPRGMPATEDPWMDCSVEPAAAVNRLLAAAGSSRRLALFWPGGNDGFSVLGEASVLRGVGERGRAAGSWDYVIP
jgi:hypothetical protein